MRLLCYFFFLVTARVTVAAEYGLERRSLAFDVKPIIHPDDPTVDPTPEPDEPGESPSSTSPESPGLVSGGISSGGGVIGQTGGLTIVGTASHSTNPFQDEAESDEDEELVEKILETVKELFDKINDAVGNASPTTTLTSSIGSPTTGAISATYGTANGTSAGGNGTYNAVSDPRIPSLDIANMLAQQNDLQYWNDMFTSDEYDMYQNDPICFYANIESMYSSASFSAAATPSTSGSDPAVTSGPSKRSLSLRQSDVNETCITLGPGASACSPVSGSPQWSSSLSETVSEVYVSALPSQLSMIHLGTPSVSGVVTATAVSSTSCSGLDGGPGPVTSYRELKVSATPTTNSASAPSSTTASGVSNGGASLKRHSLLLVAGSCAALWLAS